MVTGEEVQRTMIRLSMGTDKNRADLLPGTLDMLVLKILMSGHLHGYAIAQLILQLSDDLLRRSEVLRRWSESIAGLNQTAHIYRERGDGKKPDEQDF